jgi:hypothetical protein
MLQAQKECLRLFPKTNTYLCHAHTAAIPDRAVLQFDLSSQVWVDLTSQVMSDPPLARTSFGMCRANGSIYLFGGNAAGD